MALYPMSPVDAAWLHMDGPANLAEVTGLLTTREPLDFGAVRAIYAQRLADLDRFHQRVVHQGVALSTPYWQDMAHFDIDQHLHHIALAAPYDAEALRVLVADLASTPLNRDLPLWQVHVIDDVDNGSALVMRYHHCIGDGTAMMEVARRLFTPQNAGQAKARPRRKRLGASAATSETPAQQNVNPAALAVGGAGMLLSELIKWPDPGSPFKGEFGLRKQVAWSSPVAIEDVKAVGARHEAKVNDVLVAAVAGALRSYLRQRGVDVDQTTLRAMVPVDLRAPAQRGQLGNAFGLVILDLPVNTAQQSQRMALTKERMDALKHSAEPLAMEFLFNIFGRGPKALEDVASAIFGSKTSLVLTNVAGPREPLLLARAPIERMMFWVPHPGRQLGLGISIMSYNGVATLTVIADAHLVPDPQTITQLFNREFGLMLHSVRTEQARTALRGLHTHQHTQ